VVRFNPKARLDRSRVKDVGGSGGGGGLGGPGMRIPIPGGLGAKGGIGGVILIIALVILAQCTGVDLLGGGGGGTPNRASGDINDTRYANCETGEDANNNPDCARVAIENSITNFWATQDVKNWHPIEGLYTFTGQVDTGCGAASTAVGPFYCPSDESIYLDTTFFDEVLERQLGGPDGGFVEAYVLAHEYGHHISNLIGDMSRVTNQKTGPESLGVRLELQADCFAGVWTSAAEKVPDANGEPIILDVTDEDIRLALEAAASVGDDYIQNKTQGQVNEETWTHGSSAQRQYWFNQGYHGGSMDDCRTFDVDSVQVP
jgi:predicted metalloprotease